MIQYILCLTLIGTLGAKPIDNSHQLALLDLKDQVQIVMDAAKYYLHEGAPSITKLFVVDNPDEIIRLEGQLKNKILEDLLEQLVEVWAEMNIRVLKGYKVLKSLRDKAARLVTELKEHGLADMLDNDDVKERIAKRVKELLDNAKQVFCVQTGNLTGLALTEKQLLGLTSKLEYDHVKIHLLKMVYSYRLGNLLNVTNIIDKREYEMLKDVWVMVSAWGKWAVLDLMAFIKEPLGDLHNDVQKYVNSLMESMEELVDETLDNVLEIAITTDNDNYSTELLKLFTMMTEVDNPLYVLCK